MSETFGATFVKADIESLGAVAETETRAGMATPEGDPVAPAGDTLLIGADSTTSFCDGEWHEVKGSVVGTLGSQLRHDAETG